MKKAIYNIKKFFPYIIYQTKANLKAEITGSYLGTIWLFLEPLSFMLIYTFIGEVVFDKSTEYFPVFVFSGLIFWNFFNSTLRSSVKLISKNKGIITKVYVPKYIFLIINIFVNLYKLMITFSLLIILFLIYQIPISFNILLVIPLLLNLCLFTFGISLYFMHYGVIITDLTNVVNILLKLMFYLTGIFYSILERIPAPYNTIAYYLNPIAFFIIEFRNCFIYSNGINWIIYFIWLIISLLLIITGINKIDKYENSYVKVMR